MHSHCSSFDIAFPGEGRGTFLWEAHQQLHRPQARPPPRHIGQGGGVSPEDDAVADALPRGKFRVPLPR